MSDRKLMRKTNSIIAALAAAVVVSACSTETPAADSTAAAPSTTRTISPPGTLDATYVAIAARFKEEGIPHMNHKMLEELAHHLCDAKDRGLGTEARVIIIADSDFNWTTSEAERIDEELIKRTCA